MLSPTAWKSEGSFFEFKGHKIFYRTEQNIGKPKLILLHGFPTASWDWEAIWPLLAFNFELYALDFLGFGFSDKPHPHAYSINEQADLVIDFFRQQEISDVHIMAHDYAVSVAQELLARQQDGPMAELIKSICFLNGGMFPQSYRPRLIQKLLLSPIGPILSVFVSKGSLRRNFKAIFGKNQPSPVFIDYCWELITHNRGKRVVPYVIQYLRDRKRNADRWSEAVRESTIPMRLINGPEDPISGAHLADKYATIAPQADVIRLEGVGHYPNVEAPAEVAAAYLSFFQSSTFIS